MSNVGWWRQFHISVHTVALINNAVQPTTFSCKLLPCCHVPFLLHFGSLLIVRVVMKWLILYNSELWQGCEWFHDVNQHTWALAALTDKRPAQRKSSIVDGVIWRENNKDRWARWGNCPWYVSAVLAELWWIDTGTVVQRHTVVTARWMCFQW